MLSDNGKRPDEDDDKDLDEDESPSSRLGGDIATEDADQTDSSS